MVNSLWASIVHCNLGGWFKQSYIVQCTRRITDGRDMYQDASQFKLANALIENDPAQEIRDQGTESDHADWRQDIFINPGNRKLVVSFFRRERSNDRKYICSLQALLPTDWWKSDSSVDGKPQRNCRQNSNSRDVVASPPPFRALPPEQPRGLGLLLIGQVRLLTQQENLLVWDYLPDDTFFKPMTGYQLLVRC